MGKIVDRTKFFYPPSKNKQMELSEENTDCRVNWAVEPSVTSIMAPTSELTKKSPLNWNLSGPSTHNCYMRPSFTGSYKEELEYRMYIGLASKVIITLWSSTCWVPVLRTSSIIASVNFR